MASVVVPGITKQPMKIIEIPLRKFSEEIVPYHQKAFDEYRTTVTKLISLNNVDQLKRELKDKKRTIKQLRDLMYELETLRTQVEDSDLDKFDSKTVALRKIMIGLIQKYSELEKNIDQIVKTPQREIQEKENYDPFEGASQIQVQDNLDELKLQNRQETLNRVEEIHQDVQDLHEMYKNLNEMVEVQGETINSVDKSVDSAQQNVENGTRELVKAHKLKAVAYPVTGAFLGGIIGGPIGLVAGVKIGGIAAIGCAIAGYTGGKFFNKFNNPDKIQPEIVRQDKSLNEDVVQKKEM